MGRVVVGVDGSEAGQEALAFAADEARMRGASLELVHVRPRMASVPSDVHGLQSEFASAGSLQASAERGREDAEEAETRVRQAAENLVKRLLSRIDADGIAVQTTVVVDRRPARRLVEHVNGRDDVELLVVGSRGLGELSGRLLGSVSQACVTHARVPVTVVHRRRD